MGHSVELVSPKWIQKNSSDSSTYSEYSASSKETRCFVGGTCKICLGP